jgi:hypothetical protein
MKATEQQFLSDLKQLKAKLNINDENMEINDIFNEIKSKIEFFELEGIKMLFIFWQFIVNNILC